MKFKVHRKTEDGQLGDLLTLRLNPPLDSSDITTVFDTAEAARVSLLESLRVGLLTGKFEDYVVQSYNDSDEPIVEVSKADREAAAADLQKLIVAHESMRLPLAAMIAARQLYAFAVTVAEKAVGDIQKVGEEERPPHPLTLEVMLQASNHHASKPFKETELLTAFGNSILPWMHNLIKDHLKQEEDDKVKAIEEAEKARRASVLPIGIPTEHGQPADLHRQKAVVLVGFGPAVRYLLDHAVTTVLAARDETHPIKVFTVVRFCDNDKTMTPQERYLPVQLERWKRICQSEKRMAKIVHDHIVPHLHTVLDLLVVDDLYTAAGGIFVRNRSISELPFKANMAHKTLMRWARYTGFGLLAAVPTDEDTPPSVDGLSWELLRTHAIVRPVTVIRSAPDLELGKVRIQVGRDAFSVDVDWKVLEAPNQIIV